MDADGGLGIRRWGCFEPPSKGNLSSSVAERDAKPLLPNGGFIHRQGSVPVPPAPLAFVREGWLHHGRSDFGGEGWVRHANDSGGKNSLIFPTSSCGIILSDPSAMPNVQMLQHPEPKPKDDKVLMMVEETNDRNEAPLKKRPRGRPQKSPKPNKPKKASAPRDGAANDSQGKTGRRSAGMVINGIDFDISTIPTPVCSCTGKQQQCYRWGIGGWQSACCTTTISMYPLPMNTKKCGARIAGRKMSQGAFKKVLEKLAGEGYNLHNPIDLRTFWAKHGTNKFVTIR